MKFNKLVAVAGCSAALGFGGCEMFDEPKANEISDHAYQVENDLAKTIREGNDVETLPGAIVVDEAINLREAPAPINFNLRAFIDGVESRNGNFVLTRPFIVKNEEQIEDDDPEIWLAAGNLEDDRPGPGGKFVFLGLSKETLKYIRYYSKVGTTPAIICDDEIKNTYKSPVQETNHGLTISPDGFPKNVGLLQDLTDQQTISVLNSKEYIETGTCR